MRPLLEQRYILSFYSAVNCRYICHLKTNLCRHNFSTLLIRRLFAIIVFLINLTYNWNLFRNEVLLFLITNSSCILIYDPIILLITYCKTVYWIATDRWFSPGTLVSSTYKTDSHDITEIVLRVALNTITLTLIWTNINVWM